MTAQPISKLVRLMNSICNKAHESTDFASYRLDESLLRFSITTPARQSAFLAQCAHESAGFSASRRTSTTALPAWRLPGRDGSVERMGSPMRWRWLISGGRL